MEYAHYTLHGIAAVAVLWLWQAYEGVKQERDKAQRALSRILVAMAKKSARTPDAEG